MNASAALQVLTPAAYNFGMIARRDECPNYLPLTKSIRAGCKSYGLRDILLNSADVIVMEKWADEKGLSLSFKFTGSKQWVRCTTALNADQFVSLRNFVIAAQRVARAKDRRNADAIAA